MPFDEDEKDPSVWFLDHDYMENMCAMFRKVNCEWTREGGRRGRWEGGMDIMLHDIYKYVKY